jgi:hypothetical protein
LREHYGDAFDNKNYWDFQFAYNNWLAGRRICLNSPDLKMVIIGNFNHSGTTAINPNFPQTGIWYDLITDETINVTNTNETIDLSPGKFKVLTNKKIDFFNDLREIVKVNLSLRQTPDNLIIVSDEPVISAKIYNINGILVKQTLSENNVPISNLPKGCYIVNVLLSRGDVCFKFLK